MTTGKVRLLETPAGIDISAPDTRTYAAFRDADTILEMSTGIRALLELFGEYLTANDLAETERTLRRMDHVTAKLAMSVPDGEAEGAVKEAVLDRALHRDHGWLNEAARAIVVAFRTFDATRDREPSSAHGRRGSRSVAGEAFAAADELDTVQSADDPDQRETSTHDRLLRFSNLISSIEEASRQLRSMLEERDARAGGCRNYVVDLVAMLCTAPTHFREEGTIKVRYLDRLRTTPLGRHTRVCLMLDATIEHERERWMPRSILDRGLYARH